MAKRILVPLDKSDKAETVVPLVADAAHGGGATVRLLHVAPKPQSWIDDEGHVIAYADQEQDRLEAEALDYLRRVEVQLAAAPVELAVRFGDPVPEILREAEVFGADLIAVTTAGQSCLGRAFFGGVAEEVFRRADTAVMLVRPHADE